MQPVLPNHRIDEAIHGDLISCSEYHGDSCVTDIMPKRFARTAELMGVTYLPIHLIPFLLFKRGKLMKNPADELKKLLKGYVKSVLFASSYTALLGFFLCKVKVVINDMDGTLITPVSAFLAGPALMFENETRRQEIALFLVPKVMEAVYALLKRRGLVKGVPHSEALLFGVATAILLYFFQNCPEHIKAGYYSLMKKLIGSDI